MNILVIVGSEMGNAEMVGDVVLEALIDAGHEAVMRTEGTPDELGTCDAVLLISSTTGLGEIPQNLEPLYDELVASRPDLSRVRYGLVGMGDRNYKESYLGGPKKLDTIFAELGAVRVAAPLFLDATDHPAPDEDAVEWLPAFLDALI